MYVLLSDPEPLTLAEALAAFGLSCAPEPLPGGTRGVVRAGDVVLKQVHETSLENVGSPELSAWIAGLTANLRQEGFRVPRPVPTTGGRWVAGSGWTAWEHLEGRHAAAADVPAVIAAIDALHGALASVEPHPLLAANTTPWGRADAACWGELPEHVDPRVAPLLDRLVALRRSIEPGPYQLIHGDLNPGNILVAATLPPAFVDFAPFWRPVDFAVAMFANWIGPRRGDLAVLAHFRDVPDFEQLLLRASIRMLLAIERFDGWETSSEKRAAELVLAHLGAA